MERNIDFIDCAKAIGIILVVYGHALRDLVDARLIDNTSGLQASDYVIYTFHMPLFFFLSGLTAGRSVAKGAVPFLKGKLRTIVYPYFLWSLLLGGTMVTLTAVTNHDKSVSRLLEILWNPISPFWFLYALFWVHVVYLLLHRIGPGWFALAAILTFAAVAFVWPAPPEIVFQTTRGLLHYSIGAMLAGRLLEGRRPGTAALVGMAGLFATAVLACLALNIRSALALPAAAAGIALTIGLGQRLAAHARWLVLLGAASMSVYVLHIFATAGTRVVMAHALGAHHGAILLVLCTLAGLVFPLAVHRAAMRLGISTLLGLSERRTASGRPVPHQPGAASAQPGRA